MNSTSNDRADFSRENATTSEELEYPYTGQNDYDLHQRLQSLVTNSIPLSNATAIIGEVDHVNEHSPFAEIPYAGQDEIKSDMELNSPFITDLVYDNNDLGMEVDNTNEVVSGLLEVEQESLQDHNAFEASSNFGESEQIYDNEGIALYENDEPISYEEEPIEETEYEIVDEVNEPEENEFQGEGDESMETEISFEETVFSDNEDLEFLDEMVYEEETVDVFSENEFIVDINKGTTEYINVSAVSNRSIQTGVFVPAGYSKADKVDLVLYFHGLFANGSKSNAMSYYWSTYANIRECFHASNRNAILIAPGLTSDPQQSSIKFGKPYALDEYISACFNELKAKNLIGLAADPGRIILAGHSAGGSPLSKILRGTNKLINNVVECWGFDCCYDYGWEKLTFVNPFYHYWAHNKNGKMSGPGVRGEALAKKFANVRSIAPRKTTYHQGIIEYAWRNEINNRSWFQTAGTNAPEYASDSSNSNTTKRVIVGIVNDNPQIEEQRALQLAAEQQVTDKNELTNLLFYLRHREYLGRELQSTDAKELKDEWMTIQKNVVAPFLKRLSMPEQFLEIPLDSTKPTGFATTSMTLSNSPIELVKANKAKGLAQVKVAPSVFLKEIVRMAFGDKSSTEWFDNFTTITFLGRRLNSDQYLHVEMAKHLKEVEKELAVKYGGPQADPVIAGDYLLGTTRESIAASRKVSGTAKYSFHMFGLAIDVNYTGNPFIQLPVRSGKNKKTKKVFKIPSGVLTMNETLVNAANLMNKPVVKFKYAMTYDQYKAINATLVEYLTLIDQKEKLRNLLLSTTSTQWKSHDVEGAVKQIQADLDKLALSIDRWTKRDQLKQKGFLNLSKEFIDGVKLNWGSWYGDMMHFDMRDRGVGKEISKAIKRYIGLMNTKAAEDFKTRQGK